MSKTQKCKTKCAENTKDKKLRCLYATRDALDSWSSFNATHLEPCSIIVLPNKLSSKNQLPKAIAKLALYYPNKMLPRLCGPGKEWDDLIVNTRILHNQQSDEPIVYGAEVREGVACIIQLARTIRLWIISKIKRNILH
jgi:hypothetical protein